MTKHYDLHKAGGILIQNKKLLVTREAGKEFFIAPGGVVEEGEDPKVTIIRELEEEVLVKATLEDILEFGTFYAEAATIAGKVLRMDVFLINKWLGEPTPTDGEEIIEEIRWLTSQIPHDIKVGSIFEHEVIPRLKQEGLIE